MTEGVLKLLVLVGLATTSITLGVILGHTILNQFFPFNYADSTCVILTQLPPQFRHWKLYLWMLDCMGFIAAGYLATIGTYLELLADYFDRQYAGYLRLQDRGSGLTDDDLRSLKQREAPANTLGYTCGVCLCDIEVRSQ
jgi:hypothetical protein